MTFSLGKPVFERHFRSVNAFSFLLATFSLDKSVIAFARVQFSPGYRIFAIWTRLRSLMCFRPVNLFFDFVTFSLSNCNFDFVSHVFAQETHFRISERRYNKVIVFKAKFSFCEERIRLIKGFLP